MSYNAEYYKAYYQQNREKILIQKKAYRAKNREKIRAKNKAFREAHPLECVWTGMMQRCGHFKGGSAEDLARYAGRGITVCEEWRHLKPFENWCLANGWQPGLQIDRVDNDGNYCPENCRFVTRTQNVRNRRNTVMFGGKSLAHWYDTMGHTERVRYDTFLKRITSYHWPICRALFEPVHQTNHPNPKANSQPR